MSRRGQATGGEGRGGERPTFKETFIAVGQDELDKNRQQRAAVYSVGVLVTGLMVVAAVLYTWTPVGSVVALVCAVVVMWGRWLINRQTLRDLTEMRRSQDGWRQTGNPEYTEFIRLRGEQMLRDNKALTPYAKQEIRALMAWAAAQGPARPEGTSSD